MSIPNQSTTPVVPSTPNPTLTSLVFLLLRYLFAGLSVLGVIHGTYSDSVLTIVASSLVGVVSVLIAIVDLIRKSIHTDKTAKINADLPPGSLPVQPK